MFDTCDNHENVSSAPLPQESAKAIHFPINYYEFDQFS